MIVTSPREPLVATVDSVGNGVPPCERVGPMRGPGPNGCSGILKIASTRWHRGGSSQVIGIRMIEFRRPQHVTARRPVFRGVPRCHCH